MVQQLMGPAKYRAQLAAMVKAAGEEVIRRAEGLVGEEDEISDFEIVLSFPQESVPTITVRREHINVKSFEVLQTWGY